MSELGCLRDILKNALEETAALWPDIRVAYGWVHGAAGILSNQEGFDGAGVKRRLRGLVGAMARHKSRAGGLEEAVGHFIKVTGSYWPGLFHCYDAADIPRTNNDLEHYFGSSRYNERRSTGRKTATSGTVIRGSVRVVSSVATKLGKLNAQDIRLKDVQPWKRLRRELEKRRETRRSQLRFRRDPASFLAALEESLLKPVLPP